MAERHLRKFACFDAFSLVPYASRCAKSPPEYCPKNSKHQLWLRCFRLPNVSGYRSETEEWREMGLQVFRWGRWDRSWHLHRQRHTNRKYKTQSTSELHPASYPGTRRILFIQNLHYNGPPPPPPTFNHNCWLLLEPVTQFWVPGLQRRHYFACREDSYSLSYLRKYCQGEALQSAPRSLAIWPYICPRSMLVGPRGEIFSTLCTLKFNQYITRHGSTESAEYGPSAGQTTICWNAGLWCSKMDKVQIWSRAFRIPAGGMSAWEG